MPSNNSKYTPEFREETARFIVESRKSASSVAEEIGIDKNTVCSWVRDYRRKNGLPSYAEERGIQPLRPTETSEENRRIRDLEKENRRLRKELQEAQEDVAILKKSLHIFMKPQEASTKQ
jgi:transposase-like protein